MVHRRRRERDRERARRAGAAAQAEGRSALDIALAEIAAAFDQAGVINGFKIRVEALIHRGPHHPAMRARFGARAALLRGRDLDAAIVTVERWWRDERKAFQIASALGRRNRLSLEVLAELRLILRIMRLKRMQAEFSQITTEICNEPMAEAAE